MKTPEPTIRVKVDVTNPGQFFACCGLLELADRLWPGTEGWFEDGYFCAHSEGSLQDTLKALLDAEALEVLKLKNGLVVKPLIAPLHLSLSTNGVARCCLTLDAWMMVKLDRSEIVVAANPPWNFWSGQQTSLRIWRSLRACAVEQVKTLAFEDLFRLFDQRVPLSGRFGFDPGAAWNALDTGFSPNEQGIEVGSSPLVELLAAVGLQRFRPRMLQDRSRFHYWTWGQPLAPLTACAAVVGALTASPSSMLCGRVVSRGSYAALGYSTVA